MPARWGRGLKNRAFSLAVIALALGGLSYVLTTGTSPPTTAQSKLSFPTANVAVGSLRITGAYIPQPASASVAAAYFTITNFGTADALVSASSDVTQDVGLHQSVTNGTVGTMIDVSSLTVPARGLVRLSPGGSHLMLLNPTPVVSGGFVEIRLTFRQAGPVSIRVPVVPLTAVSGVS